MSKTIPHHLKDNKKQSESKTEDLFCYWPPNASGNQLRRRQRAARTSVTFRFLNSELFRCSFVACQFEKLCSKMAVSIIRMGLRSVTANLERSAAIISSSSAQKQVKVNTFWLFPVF